MDFENSQVFINGQDTTEPATDPTRRFAELFRGLTRAFGQYLVPKHARADERGKIKGTASTWDKRELQRDDYRAHLAGERGLGICPLSDSGYCLFGVIDIDVYPVDHREIQALCEKYNLPLVLCRSKSGGIHAYVFLSDAVAAKLLRERLRVWARLLGHPGVELFPAQDTMSEKACGNWINLPYFDGDKTLRYAHGPEGAALKLEEFLDFAESKKVSRYWLEEWSAPAGGQGGNGPDREAGGARSCAPDNGQYETTAAGDVDLECGDEAGVWHQAPPCLVALAASKSFAKGSRNNAFFNLCVYLKKRYGEQWQPYARAINKHYFDPPLEPDRVRATLQSVSRRKSYNYTCSKPPICNVCDRATCVTRQFGVSDGEAKPSWDVSVFENVIKIAGEPPIWRMKINGQRVTFGTKELTLEWLFRAKAMEADLVLGKIEEEDFVEFVRKLLDGCDVEEVPNDAKMSGMIKSALAEFCGGRLVETNPDREEAVLMDHIWSNEGRVYFKPLVFTNFLAQYQRLRYTPEVFLTTMLDLGLMTHPRRIKGRDVVLWSLPMPSVQTEPFAVPRVQPEEPF